MSDYPENNNPMNESNSNSTENPNPNPQFNSDASQPNGNSDPYRTTGSNTNPNSNAYGSPQGTYHSQGPYRQPPSGSGWTNSNGNPPQTPPNNYAGNYQNPYSGPYQQNQNGNFKWNYSDYESADGKKGAKKKRKGLMIFTGVLCSLLGVAVIGLAGVGIWRLVGNGITEPASSAAASSSTADNAAAPGLIINDVPQSSDTISADGQLTTKQIYAKVSPSVVGIIAYINSGNTLYNFNGNQLAQSQGSGIVMSADGYIITNAHVISGASGYKVVLNNGEEYNATLVGTDNSTDLAVLKIDAQNLTPAEFGDSAQMEVGEEVVAIGNPGGLQLSNSMSRGIVSGLNRAFNTEDGSYTMNYIQTDAAINPGNSGGALVNEFGQVVGINSVKIASTEYEGLGFAIPIADARPIVEDLIANGRVTGRVRLGVSGALIDEVTARYNSVPTGFMVYSAEADADIASKGVIAGDIITKIDDTEITSQTTILDYLKSFKPGDKVTLTIYRRTSGKADTTFQVEVVLMEDVGTANTPTVQPQASNGGF